MKKLFLYLISTIAVLGFGGIAYASTISNTPNLFETYLANSEGSTDTSMVLASSVLRDGSTLSGYTCFTIDSNTPTVEYECGTVSGTTVSGLTRGIDAVTGTTSISSLEYAHHRGADVKITDYPTLTILSRIFQGIDGIAQPFFYDSGVSTTSLTTNRSNIVDYGLLQDTALNGAGILNAGTGVKGVVQIATLVQSASSTGTGSSGAILVIPSSSATSTYNVQTAPLHVVVTGNNGFIDPNFLGTAITNFSSTTVIGSTVALSIGKNMQQFTFSGNFPIPNGIKKVYAKIVGGGGGGGTNANGTCASGGGAGAYGEGVIDVSATTSLTLFVAASQIVGSTGSTTSIASVMSATGGSPGSNGATLSGSPNGTAVDGGAGGTTVSGATASSTGAQGAGCISVDLANGLKAMNGVGSQSVLGSFGAGGNSGQAGNGGEVILYW